MSADGDATEIPGKALAVISAGLYLINLLLPLLPLLGLVWLYFQHRNHAPRLAKINLMQALIGAALSSALFAAANILILSLGGYRSLHALIVFEVYYILVVPLFLIPGLITLVKAMSGQLYRFPLIGGKDAG